MENLFEDTADEKDVESLTENGQVAETDEEGEKGEAQTADAKRVARQEREEFFKNEKKLSDLFKEKAKVEAEAAQAKKELEAYKKSLGALGYEGKADEIRNRIEAAKTGKSVDEVKAERERIEAEIKADLEVKLRKEMEQEAAARRQVADDLAAIKAKYPDVKAESPIELGEKFIKLMQTGALSAVEAYELTREKSAPKPVSTGSTAGGAGVEKDYYTPEEVDAMSRAEIKKNFDKVEKSMKRWQIKK